MVVAPIVAGLSVRYPLSGVKWARAAGEETQSFGVDGRQIGQFQLPGFMV